MKISLSRDGRILILLYIVATFCLFLYSYTQVDLGMTLSRVTVWQVLQKNFQYIGYFNRPLSTTLYLIIIAVFFILYGFVLAFIRNHKLHLGDVLLILAILVVAGIFSYPAFSYDFFNYLFTAKTVLVYHKNPYIVTPLQFTGVEPWLSFMHWTHLPTAYTPLWILVTIPFYILGFGYFLLLMWNLKIAFAGAYICTAFGIYRILKKGNRDMALLGMMVFACNPLIIIECLISPHNDILMMMLVVWSIVFYRQGRRWLSWVMLSLSVAMKLMTIFCIPAFFFRWNRKIALVCMTIGLAAVLTQRDILAWYWVWIMPFLSIFPESTPLITLAGGVSLGLVLRYAPFLYFGSWDKPVPTFELLGTWIPILASIVVIFISYIRRRVFPVKSR